MIKLRNIRIWLRLVAGIAIILVVAELTLIAWTTNRQQAIAIAQARDFSQSVHQITLAGLTGMMLTGTVSQRAIFLDQVRQSTDIRSLHIIRGDAVINQFGNGTPDEITRDEVEQKVLQGQEAYYIVVDDDNGRSLRAVIPVIAQKNYLGKNCLNCHLVPEGTVLGLVSMRLSLGRVDEAVYHFRLEFIAAAIILLVPVVLFIYLSVRSAVAKPLSEITEHFEKINKGNLAETIENDHQDELGQALQSLAHMQKKLATVLWEVEECGRFMGQSAYQVATISREIAEVSKNQESRSEEVTGSMKQLHQISSDVMGHANDAAIHSREVEAVAQEGIKNVQLNIASMASTSQEVAQGAIEIQELEKSAQQIYSIASTIEGIAGQTNLLALNAAIEAARAGENGRGFAVVADEVRKLAERSTHAAKEVSVIIGDVSHQVQQIAATMQVAVSKVNESQAEGKNTENAIREIANHVIETAKANRVISEKSQQQLEQFTLLELSLDTLFAVLKENGRKVDTTAIIGNDLRIITDKLNNIMSGFTLSKISKVETTQHENRRAPRAQNSLLVKVIQNGTIQDAVANDYSLTGIRLRVSEALNENKDITLQMYLPNADLDVYASQAPLNLDGKILWEKKEGDNYICGVEFQKMNNDQRIQLKECFAFYGKSSEFTNAA